MSADAVHDKVERFYRDIAEHDAVCSDDVCVVWCGPTRGDGVAVVLACRDCATCLRATFTRDDVNQMHAFTVADFEMLAVAAHLQLVH